MKRLISLLMCLLLALAMLAPTATAEELPKDVTIRVYSWWDPTKPGMIGLKEGFEEKYADYNVTLEFVKISSYYQTMLTKLAGIQAGWRQRRSD